MKNHFSRFPLWEVGRTLSAVAAGREPADTVVKNAALVNVCTGEILKGTDIAISMGRIALVGDASHCVGDKTAVLDAEGQYLAPGFLDGHIHVESSMMGVGEYARAVIPHGTVGIYMDPHEICNVLGLRGVELMCEDAARTPLKAMVTTPSCVPAVPGFEDTGSFVGPGEIAEAMKRGDTVGLGEMMNFPGIINSDAHAHGMVAETLKAGKTVTGHYSVPETGRGLNAYAAAGIRCCHESTRAEDALAKMRLGMYAMIREGSAWRDLHEVIKCVTQNRVDSRFAVLVSDDAHPRTLVAQGHMDHILRRAMEEGLDPVTAIQMVTVNCAQCFGMDHELGSVAPGKCADLVLLSSLKDMRVTRVLIDGETVALDGRMTADFAPYGYPEWALGSMRIGREITADSFRMPARKAETEARVIRVLPGKVGNVEESVILDTSGGEIKSDPSRDVLKAAVFERHHETGSVGFGLVSGFGIKNGAMASTVAHDAHNLLVIGTDDAAMALAANTLIREGGGMAVARDGHVLGCVPLPIAGLMNDKPCEEMSAMVEGLESAWKQIGCEMPSPFMTMSLIPLACLPQLRLTNRGLVDCTAFTFVPLEK
jgi:adenine deaminase